MQKNALAVGVEFHLRAQTQCKRLISTPTSLSEGCFVTVGKEKGHRPGGANGMRGRDRTGKGQGRKEKGWNGRSATDSKSVRYVKSAG